MFDGQTCHVWEPIRSYFHVTCPRPAATGGKWTFFHNLLHGLEGFYRTSETVHLFTQGESSKKNTRVYTKVTCCAEMGCTGEKMKTILHCGLVQSSSFHLPPACHVSAPQVTFSRAHMFTRLSLGKKRDCSQPSLPVSECLVFLSVLVWWSITLCFAAFVNSLHCRSCLPSNIVVQ